MLRRLILLEVARRRRRGDLPRPEDYRERFPTLDGAWLAQAAAGQIPDEDLPSQSTRSASGPLLTASLRCPHCHHSIPVDSGDGASLLCPLCGSSFRLARDAAGRWMESLLAGVSPADPAAFAAAIVLSLAVTLGGSVLPALRAARTDPRSAMASE